MCDYSLEMYRSRPAHEGVNYETHRFQTGSIGFVAPEDPSTAICMASDMRLKLEGIPARIQVLFDVTANEVVIFTRLETGMHRDGVHFTNGTEVTLQQLGLGVAATVIDALSAEFRMRQTVDAAKINEIVDACSVEEDDN